MAALSLYPVLYPVLHLCPLGIVEPAQVSHQVTGNPADALERYSLEYGRDAVLIRVVGAADGDLNDLAALFPLHHLYGCLDDFLRDVVGVVDDHLSNPSLPRIATTSLRFMWRTGEEPSETPVSWAFSHQPSFLDQSSSGRVAAWISAFFTSS